MITDARIREELAPAGLDWITALRAPAIQALAADKGPLQMSLFDERDMAEIASPDYPGERLIVCRNRELAAERARKRRELLDATGKGVRSRKGKNRTLRPNSFGCYRAPRTRSGLNLPCSTFRFCRQM
jgi:hypothetical protein